MLYLEDCIVGRVFASASHPVTADDIKTFAAQWDPQVFHLDEEGAAETFFQGLAASGWHTACLTMRLLITGEFRPANGVIGAGIEDLKWHRPVRAGDVLTVRAEVLDARAMRSRPGFGIVRMRVETLDAEGVPVQTFHTEILWNESSAHGSEGF